MIIYKNGTIKVKFTAFTYKLWSDASALTFTQVAQNQAADIELLFAKGPHGDAQPFDGPGGDLAHAFYPLHGGDVHLDDTEPWTVDSFEGTNLLIVAAHEIGHSLGLAHSDVWGALMHRSYSGYRPELALHQDDIQGIQFLYPPIRRAAIPPPTEAPTQRPRTLPAQPAQASPCHVQRWDAVATTADDNTYFFTGAYYYLRGSKYRRLISDDWPGLGPNIDAAFKVSERLTIFTQGGNLRVFHNKQPVDSQERRISDYYVGLPSSFDAAWVWKGTFHVSRGTKYSRYNGPIVSLNRFFPMDLSQVWRGLPQRIDAATTDKEGVTYFFHDSFFYEFDNKIGWAKPPQYIGPKWFGC